MSNLVEHALREFKASGYDPVAVCADGPDKWIQQNVIELLEVFGKQGHSGFSAPHCIAMFEKLANFEPLGPLTGREEEWTEVGPSVFQNKRCSHVFKQPDRFEGQAYDIEAKIFRDPDGGCYQNADSASPIIFPYTPAREYIDRPATTEATSDDS